MQSTNATKSSVPQAFFQIFETSQDESSNNNDKKNQTEMHMPAHLIEKLNLRHQKHDRKWYNSNNKHGKQKKSALEKFICELIDCLSIANKRDLSPIIQSELIALIIRSYLAEDEIRVALSQPLKSLLHSPFHAWGFVIIPPRKQGIQSPMHLNTTFQWEIISDFSLENYIGKIWHAILIGNKHYKTLVVSTPSDDESVLYCQKDKNLSRLYQIKYEIVHLWKQNNNCFALTRKRLSFKKSELAVTCNIVHVLYFMFGCCLFID